MALLQFGPNLMPSGAAKHAADFPDQQTRAVKCLSELLMWLARFSDAVFAHRNKEETKKARQRSGSQFGQSGLTQDQKDQRSRRDREVRRLKEALRVQAELQAYKNCDYSHFKWPRCLSRMQPWEQEAFADLQSGELQQDVEAAKKAHGGRVQALPFRL